jgi:hypothetical protein
VSKPDLIELSTDWDTALRVADRYTGLGGERANDQNFLEQGARLLAAVLVIANQEGKSYRWVGDLLEDSDHADIKAIIEEPSADPEVPLQHLREIVSTDVPTRSRIFFTAYSLFSKALQPRSVLDPDIDEDWTFGRPEGCKAREIRGPFARAG